MRRPAARWLFWKCVCSRDAQSTFHRTRFLSHLEIPDDLVTELGELPKGWNDFPYSEDARKAGDRWIQQSESVAMLVPSAVLPKERNILINPAHARFASIRIGDPEPGAFDKRLFGGK